MDADTARKRAALRRRRIIRDARVRREMTSGVKDLKEFRQARAEAEGRDAASRTAVQPARDASRAAVAPPAQHTRRSVGAATPTAAKDPVPLSQRVAHARWTAREGFVRLLGVISLGVLFGASCARPPRPF